MRNIVIVGSGPIGLYLAIRFSKLSLAAKENFQVTVVDKYSGNYQRRMLVASNSLALIEAGVGQYLNVPASDDVHQTGMYINELEAALYAVAQSLPIQFVKSNFTDIGQDCVILTSGNVIPCDIVFDCTGEKRAVISKINEKKSSHPPFQIKPIGENPVKNHFVASVTLPKTVAKLNEVMFAPLHFASIMEELRTQFHWREFSVPYFRKFAQMENNTFEFYYEMPDKKSNETEAFQKAWLCTLLKLFYNVQVSEFEINKAKFRRFQVDPHAVYPAFYNEGEFPVVIPCGDAHLSPDYRQGIGIESGIRRANQLLAACSVRNNLLFIEMNRYDFFLNEVQGWHLKRLTDAYRLQMEFMTSTHIENAEISYTNALSQCHETDKYALISIGLECVKLAKRAMKRYEEALSLSKSIFDREGKIRLTSPLLYVANPDELENYHAKLTSAYSYSKDALAHSLSVKIEKSLLHLAMEYKTIASVFYVANDSHKLGLAKVYYEKSLELFKLLSKKNPSVIIVLYSNLAIIANARRDYHEAFRRTEEARFLLSIDDEAKVSTPKKVQAKVSFQHWKARLSMPDDLNPELLLQAESEIDDLHNSENLSPAERNNLRELMSRRFETISPSSPTIG